MSDLTADEKARFRRACRDDGINPQQKCPLCYCYVAAKVVKRTGYCDTHLNWTHDDSTIHVECKRCDRTWGVIGPIICDGADDGHQCRRRRFVGAA